MVIIFIVYEKAKYNAIYNIQFVILFTIFAICAKKDLKSYNTISHFYIDIFNFQICDFLNSLNIV